MSHYLYFLPERELEEQRSQNQKLYQEKLASAAKAREAAHEEMNICVEKMRQQIEEVLCEIISPVSHVSD